MSGNKSSSKPEKSKEMTSANSASTNYRLFRVLVLEDNATIVDNVRNALKEWEERQPKIRADIVHVSDAPELLETLQEMAQRKFYNSWDEAILAATNNSPTAEPATFDWYFLDFYIAREDTFGNAVLAYIPMYEPDGVRAFRRLSIYSAFKRTPNFGKEVIEWFEENLSDSNFRPEGRQYLYKGTADVDTVVETIISAFEEQLRVERGAV